MKANGDEAESKRISLQRDNFKRHEASLNAEIAALTKKEESAVATLNTLIQHRETQSSVPEKQVNSMTPTVTDDDISRARNRKLTAHDKLLKAKARKSALPDMRDLSAMLEMYDKQLLADVRAIRDVFSRRGAFNSDPLTERRKELRPHYKTLVEAYENEFEKNRGLADETIIRFFDSYVHDSLAAFAKDATIPSDPRVVYLGGDKKYQYARLDSEDRTKDFEVGMA
jgi:hypothetical protein